MWIAQVLWLLLGCQSSTPAPVGPGTESLRVLIPREPLEIDPRFAADVYSLKVSRLLFASLVTIEPDTLKPIPSLAKRITPRSPTHYEVQLKPGLHFSDGSALDSTDVAATFRGVVSARLGSRYASTYRRIQRIEVHDALRLSFHLESPHATFITDLEMPVLRAEDAFRPLGHDALPVVSGPYRLLRWERSELELASNPQYHAGAPRFGRVRMRVVRDDNIRALRMLTGAGDLALDAVPALLLPLFEHQKRFAVEHAPGVGTTYLGVNTESPALADVRVRRALAHAIDRQKIVARKLGGRARLASSFVPPGHWAHAPDTPLYGFAPSRARQLLQEAGRRGPMRLTLRCRSDRETVSMARVLAAMLGQIGIDVVIQPSELSTLLADLKQGRFELTYLQMPELLEPHVLSWFFASSHIPQAGNEGANRWRLRDEALDQALEDGRSQEDLAMRRDAYRRAQLRLASQLPVIPLWHEDKVVVLGPRARGFTVTRHGRFDGLFR